jgi:hypothetical protein
MVICALLGLTLRNEFLQSAKKIRRSNVANRLKSIIVGNVNMRAEIMGSKAQTDDQAFVSKNLLFISKNGVGELRVKGRESFRLRLARLHDRDLKRIVGIARP